MRRSTPGKKMETRRKSTPKEEDVSVPHDPEYEMQYGCSRKTGRFAGGFFWNPPDYCESPRIQWDIHGDRWVSIYFCKRCTRWKTDTCPARQTTTKIYNEGFVLDTPETRKQKKRRRN